MLHRSILGGVNSAVDDDYHEEEATGIMVVLATASLCWYWRFLCAQCAHVASSGAIIDLS